MGRQYRTLIWDVETDGLLDQMTRIHTMCIREYETGETWTFRRNDHEDTIRRGVMMLHNAACVVGHNIYHFDIPAVRKIFPWFDPQGQVRDTLVLARLIFADQKDKDFRLAERNKLPGAMIGQHTLESWGYRLGLQKGDYKKEKEAEAKALGITDLDDLRKFVWGTWNKSMEDYCVLDVDVTTKLWTKIKATNYPENVVIFEHQIHELAGQMEINGFPFDDEAAHKLAEEIETKMETLRARAVEHYGRWLAPAKKRVIMPLWDDPEGKNAEKDYAAPRPEFGEDDSRAVWAEVTVPKKTMNSKNPLKPSRTEGAPYCAIQLKEFNPGSRTMIIDRFTTVYDWVPTEFTETGSPTVDDEVLKNLAGKIPMAAELAEVFYLQKRIGQIKTGNNAWLKKQNPKTGRIHCYINTGGTVSGRCSHSNPNIAQVPKVKAKKIDGVTKVLKGRDGDHGWECRDLFFVPDGWTLIGCDLSGIELRCLASLARPFDNGYLVNQILDGDIHSTNQEAAGLSSRDQAKVFIYALIYGAGDVKIGSIVEPLADEETQREIGKRLKEQFFARLPGLAAAVKKIQKQAKRGWIEGLDGRRLLVRSKHAALNLRLQSDGAVIAKRWALIAEDKFLDAGLDHGWDRDFAFLAFVHDELQVAVRDEAMENIVEFAKRTLVEAAAEAGRYYDFGMPVDAEAKHGYSWAGTH